MACCCGGVDFVPYEFEENPWGAGRYEIVTPSLLEAAFLSILEALARLTFSSHSLLMAKIWSPTRILPSFLMAPLTDLTRTLFDLVSWVSDRPGKREKTDRGRGRMGGGEEGKQMTLL